MVSEHIFKFKLTKMMIYIYFVLPSRTFLFPVKLRTYEKAIIKYNVFNVLSQNNWTKGQNFVATIFILKTVNPVKSSPVNSVTKSKTNCFGCWIGRNISTHWKYSVVLLLSFLTIFLLKLATFQPLLAIQISSHAKHSHTHSYTHKVEYIHKKNIARSITVFPNQ